MKTKFAIGCLVQWYEIEMVNEYIMSIEQSLKPFENKEAHLKMEELVRQVVKKYSMPYYKSTNYKESIERDI